MLLEACKSCSESTYKQCQGKDSPSAPKDVSEAAWKSQREANASDGVGARASGNRGTEGRGGHPEQDRKVHVPGRTHGCSENCTRRGKLDFRKPHNYLLHEIYPLRILFFQDRGRLRASLCPAEGGPALGSQDLGTTCSEKLKKGHYTHQGEWGYFSSFNCLLLG